jgi:hypothetical protein
MDHKPILNAWWRRFLDRGRMRMVRLAELGISTTLATIADLDEEQRKRCIDFAAQAVEAINRKFAVPMPIIQHVVWRRAHILDSNELRREYRNHLISSRYLQGIGDVAHWVIPTLIQFCAGCEIARREMWSDEGREQAMMVSILASNKIGNLATGRAPGRAT